MPIERARVHTVLAAEPLHIVDLHPGHEGRVHRLHLEPPSRHARQSRPPKPSRSCDTSTGTLSATHVMGLDIPPATHIRPRSRFGSRWPPVGGRRASILDGLLPPAAHIRPRSRFGSRGAPA